MLRNGCLITFKKIQKLQPEVFYQKAVLLKTFQCSQDEQENTWVEVSFWLQSLKSLFSRASASENKVMRKIKNYS